MARSRSPQRCTLPPDELHARISAGDRGALEQLSRDALTRIARRLRRSFPLAPTDFIADAAEDAILEYARQPQRFIGGDGSLDAFLAHAARRNLQNRLRSERRRHVRELEYARQWPRFAVLLGTADANARELRRTLRRAVSSVCDGVELPAAMAWLRNAGTDEIAAWLDLTHVNAVERRREVKRFKDRLVKRIRRYLRQR